MRQKECTNQRPKSLIYQRPKSLISHISKIFLRVILQRLIISKRRRLQLRKSAPEKDVAQDLKTTSRPSYQKQKEFFLMGWDYLVVLLVNTCAYEFCFVCGEVTSAIQGPLSTSIARKSGRRMSFISDERSGSGMMADQA